VQKTTGVKVKVVTQNSTEVKVENKKILLNYTN